MFFVLNILTQSKYGLHIFSLIAFIVFILFLLSKLIRLKDCKKMVCLLSEKARRSHRKIKTIIRKEKIIIIIIQLIKIKKYI